MEARVYRYLIQVDGDPMCTSAVSATEQWDRAFEMAQLYRQINPDATIEIQMVTSI